MRPKSEKQQGGRGHAARREYELSSPPSRDELTTSFGRIASLVSGGFSIPGGRCATGLVRALPVVMQPPFPVDVVQVPLGHDHELVVVQFGVPGRDWTSGTAPQWRGGGSLGLGLPR